MFSRLFKNPTPAISNYGLGLRIFTRGSYTARTQDPVTAQFEEKRHNPEFAKIVSEIQEKIKQYKSNPRLFSFSTIEPVKSKDNEKAQQEERASRKHSVF